MAFIAVSSYFILRYSIYSSTDLPYLTKLSLLNSPASLLKPKTFLGVILIPLLLVYPQRKDLTINGKDNLSSYKWAPKSCDHLFCSKCGSSMFASPPPEEGKETDSMAINVRMVSVNAF